MTTLPELTTETILDAWVATGRAPAGGWTVPRLIEAIQREAREGLDAERLTTAMRSVLDVTTRERVVPYVDAIAAEYARLGKDQAAS